MTWPSFTNIAKNQMSVDVLKLLLANETKILAEKLLRDSVAMVVMICEVIYNSIGDMSVA